MAKAKAKFTAGVVVRTWVEVPVVGDTLADALESAKALEFKDVVTIKGEEVDGNMEVIGVQESSVYDKLHDD